MLYACSLGTGFVGTFDEVQAHEQRILAARASAPYGGPAAAAAAGHGVGASTRRTVALGQDAGG